MDDGKTGKPAELEIDPAADLVRGLLAIDVTPIVVRAVGVPRKLMVLIPRLQSQPVPSWQQ